MNRMTLRSAPGILLALITLTLVFVTAPATAVPMSAATTATGADGRMDIGALMDRAKETLDLEVTDVVLLFDGRDVAVASDGSVTTTFHQIVWISTELGIEEYADLRIPWNSTNATLEVKTLRTWMDGRWWPHETSLNPTAIVETLPYAIAGADDYTTMRETMLLHDGVEIPCIMETVYSITRRFPDGIRSDGLWLFHRDDPAVRVAYSVSVPGDVALAFAVGNGAPEPDVVREGRVHRYVWEMRDQQRRGVPHVSDAAAHAPYAVWSTWNGWSALGEALTASIDGALDLVFGEGAEHSDTLRDTVAALTEYEPHAPARVEAVAGFIAETTRYIGYDTSHWALAPRPAGRTFETAYGHRFDRAVLATALLREVEGVTSVTPLYRTRGPAGIDADVAGLSRLGGVELLVEGPRVRGVYDPAASTFAEGEPNPFSERFMWIAGEGGLRESGTPPVRIYGRETSRDGQRLDGAPSRFVCSVSLERDDDGAWGGRGFAEGERVLSFYRTIIGVGDVSERFCGHIVSGLVDGAEITASNVAELAPERTAVGFSFTWDPGDADDEGRSLFLLGDPAGGLEDGLPSDVHLYEQKRTSPVLLPDAFEETVLFRIHLSEDETVLAPASVELTNEVGRFAQSVERDGDWLVVRRSLSIAKRTIAPAQWLELRALLLAGDSKQHRTILFE
ncbi:DUF3857 domain-containing protein [bacterium]|nr:DUF3857 domain-containing protein [bacterium]